MKKNLQKILPHDPPMILIDELVDVDLENETVEAAVRISEDKILYDKTIKGMSPLAGIEFMAQTAGCYAYFKNGEKEPKIGYLLGSRAYNCSIEKFELGKEYKILAKQTFSDTELVSFECFIYNDGVECVNAVVNVYQPEDSGEI